jgi:hypothetical protein
MIYRNFYSELGKLFYSVAKSSGTVEKEELKKLHDMVHHELVPKEASTDEFGTDSAYYAEIEFDILNTSDADPRLAFDSFISYVEEHHTAFDDRLRSLTIRLSEELAGIESGVSAHEGKMLKELKDKLAKIDA